MFTKLSRSLYPALVRREETVSERQLQTRLAEAESDRDTLERRLAQCEEELESQKVKNRILKIEVEQLSAVCSRDLERVRKERDVHLGGRPDES